MRMDLSQPVRGMPWGEPISVAPTATVRQVAGILAHLRVGAALVRPGDDADGGGDAGIVAERDVVHAVAAGLDLDRTHARDIMGADLISVDVAARLDEVLEAMVGRNVRHIAITDGDEIVGVLSARDVLHRLRDADRGPGGAGGPGGASVPDGDRVIAVG